MPQWALTYTRIDQVHCERGKGHQVINIFTSLMCYLMKNDINVLLCMSLVGRMA